jgi:GTP-binding protein
LNKADAMTPQARASRLKALERACGRPVHMISGATGEGVPDLLRALRAGGGGTARRGGASAG